jgi:hypothetical protein
MKNEDGIEKLNNAVEQIAKGTINTRNKSTDKVRCESSLDKN